jgi:hypothetical protein
MFESACHPLKWVLVLMTYKIKELMSLSSSKFNEIKKIKKRHQICLKDGVRLKRRSFNIFYFEFEYRKHRTIKRDPNG